MIRLALLLVGTDFVRTRSRLLLAVGLGSVALGVAIAFDGLDGAVIYPLHAVAFTYLGVESTLSLLPMFGGSGTWNGLRVVRSILLAVVAVLVLDPERETNMVLAVLLAVVFALDGLLRLASAWVVRFPGYRTALVFAVAELVFAAFIAEPWPSVYEGTVPYCVGALLVLSGVGVLRMARALRTLPVGAPLSTLFARGHPARLEPLDVPASPEPEPPGDEGHPDLVVHVWTADGVIAKGTRLPIIDRYIASVDTHGKISTGHASLEVPRSFYVSHYPADDLDRSPDDFTRVLRATPDNDVPGRFLPSYPEEASEWCDATTEVVFPRYDYDRVHAFWARYRLDTTYNLTNRNCSSAVAHALEIALEGVLRPETTGHSRAASFIRLLFTGDLWVASAIRYRAETMAWTPGLVLDYARALRRVLARLEPPTGTAAYG